MGYQPYCGSDLTDFVPGKDLVSKVRKLLGEGHEQFADIEIANAVAKTLRFLCIMNKPNFDTGEAKSSSVDEPAHES